MPHATTSRIPKYRHHKPRDLAYVELNGRRTYLGRFDSPESRRRYDRLIAEWSARSRRPLAGPDDLAVAELAARFMEHVNSYYRKPDGTPTIEAGNFRLTLRPVVGLYGDVNVRDFGPTALKAVRQTWIDAGCSRRYINKHVGRVRLMIRWGVAEELVAPEVLQRLAALPGLKAGRCDAADHPPVVPVPEADVDAVLPHVGPAVRAMIRLQLLTGARAGELTILRPVDVDTSGTIWVYTPSTHKTAHHGHRRRIYFGPKGQAILRPFLSGRRLDSYCFCPAEIELERRAERHRRRKTPMSCGNVPGSNVADDPARPPGERYTTTSYCRAIHRACDKAGIPPWSPHRLRHSAATFLRKEFGLDAARIILGHRTAAITDLYAELDQSKAVEIAGQVG